MKNNLNIQLSAGENRTITEQGPFPFIHMVNSISGYAIKLLPATISFGPVIPVKKIYVNEKGWNPFFNIPIKQLAARLSEIELALDCYDISDLRLTTRGLKNLLLGSKVPPVYKLAVQMEELAVESNFQEVKELLRAIKKIIGVVLKHRNQSGD